MVRRGRCAAATGVRWVLAAIEANEQEDSMVVDSAVEREGNVEAIMDINNEEQVVVIQEAVMVIDDHVVEALGDV